MRFIQATVLTALALTLASCGPTPTDPMPAATSSNGRIRVERISVFADDLAYHDRRGVYVIVDKKTGHEFIGISGIGISEVGSHRAGKATVSDER